MGQFGNKIKKRAAEVKEKATEARKSLDRKLLDLSSTSLEDVKRKLASQFKEVKFDNEFMMALASNILVKAKKVRENINKEELVKSSKTATSDLRKRVVRSAKKKTAPKKKNSGKTQRAASAKKSSSAKKKATKKASSAKPRQRKAAATSSRGGKKKAKASK